MAMLHPIPFFGLVLGAFSIYLSDVGFIAYIGGFAISFAIPFSIVLNWKFLIVEFSYVGWYQQVMFNWIEKSNIELIFI